MRFAIAAGGTGGHLFPGLAVAEVLHASGHEVMMMTSEKHIDAVATEGRSEFRIERLSGIGLPRGISLQTLRCLAQFLKGVFHCQALFREFEPHAVLGMGGFTSTAPILAGRLRDLPVFVHESNAIPGKANRLNAWIARGLLIGLRECADRLPQVPCTFTGTPVRRSLLGNFAKGESREKFGLAADLPTVLVMGGSQGARGINQAMIGAARTASLGAHQFIHITGGADETTVRDAYKAAGVRAWVGAFHHAMQDAYGASDLAIARSGAASLTELAHFRIPAILIPYPHAAEDHQTLNAKVFEKEGAAILMPESEATAESLSRKMVEILKPGTRATMSDACARLCVDDAADRVAKVLLDAVSGGSQKR